MKPIKFKEANITLNKPQSMSDDECGPLPVYSDDRECLSCWRLSWGERFSALIFGRAWLTVFSGSTQPPVYVQIVKTVFLRTRTK